VSLLHRDEDGRPGMMQVPIEDDLCFGKKFIGENLFSIHLDDAGGLC
jgi:hypothetical protein